MPQQISDDDVHNLAQWADGIDKAVAHIRKVLEKDTAKRFTKSLMSISHYKRNVQDLIVGGSYDLEKIIEPIITLKSRADDMMAKAKEDQVPTSVFNALQTLASTISEQYAYLTAKYSYSPNQISSSEEKSVNKIASAIEILRGQIASLQNENNQSRSALQKARKQAENTDVQLSTYSQRLNSALDDINERANLVLSELSKKQAEVNELVGLISGDAVSGSYTKSALSEKKTADSMRNGSVLLMLLITLLLAVSLFESGKPHFDLETAIFRFVLSLALSVPAAYLARESSKHRAQQNLHQRTSLDLQAITPYIASLPTSEQHRLKADIASRIFGATEKAPNNIDSYPINLQELLMAAVAKVGSPKPKDKDKDD